MRLCFLGDVQSTHIQKFVEYFSKEHETHLISFDYTGDSRVKSGEEFFKSIGTNLYFIKKIYLPLSPFISKRIIQNINPDLVQAHFVTNYGFLGAFSKVRPLVISAMGSDILIHPFRNKLYYRLVVYALQNADFIICDGINSILTIRSFGIPKEKIALIYPGIDMQLFHPLEQKNIVGKNVFYSRGFNKIYDVDTLFLAMEIIHERCPDAKFTLLGVGTEFNRFRDMVIQAGMSEFVTYLNHISNKDLPQYLAVSDVSITTSLSDGGIPVSTIESMACGVPVVSTNSGDAALWIKNGESGYIVEKKNPVLLAQRVVELLNDNEKRLQFGKRARQIVEKPQDYNLEMKKIEELYLKLINDRIS